MRVSEIGILLQLYDKENSDIRKKNANASVPNLRYVITSGVITRLNIPSADFSSARFCTEVRA